MASFGDQSALRETLSGIHTLNQKFDQRGGTFFSADAHDQAKTADAFTKIHLKDYEQSGRPSLPALAIHHAKILGIDPASPEYKAMILVATKAEVKLAATPDYHSQSHYSDVAALTATLLHKNNTMLESGQGGVALTKSQQALTFIAAIGHDLEHSGNGNPPDNKLHNEEISFKAMAPLLKSAGLSPDAIESVHAIIQTTSPNGPHAVMKEAAAAQRDGRPANWAKVDPNNEFGHLIQNMAKGPQLVQMAAILSDADLGGSAFMGQEANRVLSERLTAENKAAGKPMDVTGPGARKFFLDVIVGKEGPASAAGQASLKQNFDAIQSSTYKQVAEIENANQRKLIASIEPIATSKGTYIPIDGMKPEEIEAHKKALTAQGISHTEKKSSLNGGITVLAVTSEDMIKLAGIKAEAEAAKLAVKPAIAPAAAPKVDAPDIHGMASHLYANLGDIITGKMDKPAGYEDINKAGYEINKENPLSKAGFIQINPTDGVQQNGWKIHISTEAADTGKAFNIVAKHAMENGLTAKFAVGSTLDRMSDPDNADRRGRGITLYARDEADMKSIMAKINADLEQAKVKPGLTPSVDQKIGGSPYMSYRNDQGTDGRYVDSAALKDIAKNIPADQHYNVSGKPDPFKGFDVSVHAVGTPAVAKPAVAVVAPVDHKAILAAAPTIVTNKGIYIDTSNMNAKQLADIGEALKQTGISAQAKDSASLGKPVLAVTDPEAMSRLSTIQAEAVKPAAADKVAEFKGNAASVTNPFADARLTLAQAAELKASMPTPTAPAATPIAMAAAPVTPVVAHAAKAPTAPEDRRLSAADAEKIVAARPAPIAAAAAPTKVDIDLSAAAPKTSSNLQATGQHIDKKLGRAGTAAEVIEHTAKGDYVGAGLAIAKDEGTRVAITKGVEVGAKALGVVAEGAGMVGSVAKRLPGVGAIVTVGLTVMASGVQAAQGNYGKAATELGAGAAEALGNVIGFGAGDALRETFRAAVVGVAGEKYAPEKSGLRKLGEAAYDVGSKAVASSQLKSMGKTELAAAIQKNETLPDTVKIGGKDVLLCEALKDKTFRDTMVTSLQSAAAKGTDVGTEIALINAYGDKLRFADTAPAAAVAKTQPQQQPRMTAAQLG